MSLTPRRQVYGGYQGKERPSEQERIMHLLDEYRCSEGFVAEYLGRWIELSGDEALKGGLQTIREREAAHKVRADVAVNDAARLSSRLAEQMALGAPYGSGASRTYKY